MKKILFITTSYFPFNGGQEIGLERIIKGLISDNKDINFSILTPKYNRKHVTYEKINDIDVYRYNSCLIRYPYKIFPNVFNTLLHVIYGFLFIRKFIKQINPNYAIIYFLLPSAFPALYFLRKNSIHNSVFIGGSDILNKNFLIRKMINFTLSKTEKIITTSIYLKNLIIDNYKISNKKISVIPYGINIIESKGLKNMRSNKIKILCVQRLIKSKGVDYLISALKILKDEGMDNFYLDIVGEGNQKQKLINMVNIYGLNGNVTFHGNIKNEDIGVFYQNSNVFVFPTLSEGFGIVLLEAMFNGNIILASRCSSIPEIIKDGYNGILFNPADPIDLAEKLKRVLMNIDSFKNLSINAFKNVKDYDIKVVCDKLMMQIKEFSKS